MIRLFGYKKGGVLDYITVPIVLFVLGIVLLFSYFFLDKFIEAFTDAGFYTGSASVVGQKFLNILLLFDKVMVVLLLAYIIALAYLNWKVATDKYYFVGVLILAAVVGFVGFFFDFVFSQIASQDLIVSVTQYFPVTMVICTNLHWVGLLSIVIGSITLYAKKEQGQFI